MPRSAAPLPAVAGVAALHERHDVQPQGDDRAHLDARTAAASSCGASRRTPARSRCPGPILCVNAGRRPSPSTSTNNLSEPVSIVFPGQTGVERERRRARACLRGEAATSGGTVTYSFTAERARDLPLRERHEPAQAGADGPLRRAHRAARRIGAELRLQRRSHAVRPGPRVPPPHARHRSRSAPRRRARPAVRHHGEARPLLDDQRPLVPGHDRRQQRRLPPEPAVRRARAGEARNRATRCPRSSAMANAGMSNHPFHPHGNHVRVIAQDGRLLGIRGEPVVRAVHADGRLGADLRPALQVDERRELVPHPPGPGHAPAASGTSSSRTSVTWYSGSPYLGRKATLPAGTVSYNRCGEFYYPWHSHALNEFQNFDEGFGGLATLLRVDPPVGQGTPPSCPGP